MNFKSFVQGLLSGSQPGSGKSGEWTEKRQNNRIDVKQPEEPLTVHLSVAGAGDQAVTIPTMVLNVSLRGCRLKCVTASDREKIKPGEVLLASLTIRDFSIPLRFEVIRLVGDDQVAVRFKPPYPKELERLENFLEPRCLGLSLREINPENLQNQQKGVRWFQGVNETNLFCWTQSPGGIIEQQQMIFLGRVVEWKNGGLCRTGRIPSEGLSPEHGIGWVKSELLEFDVLMDRGLLEQTKIILESATIDPAVRGIFVKKVEQSLKKES